MGSLIFGATLALQSLFQRRSSAENQQGKWGINFGGKRFEADVVYLYVSGEIQNENMLLIGGDRPRGGCVCAIVLHNNPIHCLLIGDIGSLDVRLHDVRIHLYDARLTEIKFGPDRDERTYVFWGKIWRCWPSGPS